MTLAAVGTVIPCGTSIAARALIVKAYRSWAAQEPDWDRPFQLPLVEGRMVKIGFHASHEQFAPSEMLRLVRHAEATGFDCAMSSDHFKPWGPSQGQSGYAWSWLGAAMSATALPFGVISAPGYRYHPAILAQGAATLSEMFPDRLWLALGSGQRLNEGITGAPWPDKPERNARLGECAAVIRALLAGETVTHRGRVTVVDAKLYSRPERPPMLLGAAVSPETAEFVGGWADGLLTIAAKPEQLRKVVDGFRRGGGEGKPDVPPGGAELGAERGCGARRSARAMALPGARRET
jgi:G6PDH family F420-dependent oxidoreductase